MDQNFFFHPKKVLVESGGELGFCEFCENLNITIKAAIAESLWSHGLVERHNVIIRESESKLKNDVSPLEVTLF